MGISIFKMCHLLYKEYTSTFVVIKSIKTIYLYRQQTHFTQIYKLWKGRQINVRSIPLTKYRV